VRLGEALFGTVHDSVLYILMAVFVHITSGTRVQRNVGSVFANRVFAYRNGDIVQFEKWKACFDFEWCVSRLCPVTHS
jgi:hypothetical protein